MLVTDLAQIQGVMVDYFKQRQGPMAKDGIDALKKSLAAIYYLPFQVHDSRHAARGSHDQARRVKLELMAGRLIHAPACGAVWREPLLQVLWPVHP